MDRIKCIFTMESGNEKHTVEVVCKCGNCQLLSSAQLTDLREQMEEFKGKESPDVIKVICN